ncbi:MAG TPA: hypothetical protein VHV83_21760, partial [Armatimonadota bacterium]|nr:hypothetical protein [Armatimonadota bacterium]
MAVSCRHMVHLFLVGITFLMAGSFIIAAPPTATTPANDLSCLQLSPRDETHMVQSTASAIFHGDARKLFLPTSYTQDTAPRQVFITLNDGKSPARVIDSTGYGIAKALGSAVGQAIQLTKQ